MRPEMSPLADRATTVLVWSLLVERAEPEETDLRLFWRKRAAVAALKAYLASTWPEDATPMSGDPHDAMEHYNESVGGAEHVTLAPLHVEGHQFFDGDEDRRPSCRLCREPIELAEPDEPESWIHAADSQDWGDHTAEP